MKTQTKTTTADQSSAIRTIGNGETELKDDVRETVIYEHDGRPKLELIAVGGIVWMTMQQIGEVFGVDRSVIGKHIRNIYSSGELTRAATWAKIAQVHIEGVRMKENRAPIGFGK